MSSAILDGTVMRQRQFSGLALLLCFAALCISRAAAQAPSGAAGGAQAKEGPEAIPTDFDINDEDPESSVPAAQEAMKNPLHMGYLMMAFTERAEAALKAKNPAKAAKYYQAMIKAVPDRAVSYRKACEAYVAAGDMRKAVENCRAALGKGGVTGADHLAYVRVMLKRPGSFSVAEINDVDAVTDRLASELGVGADPKGQRALAELKCQFAVRLAQADRLAACTAELERLKADKAAILPYAWALAIAQDNVNEAESVIQEAKRAGLPAASITFMEKGVERAKDAHTAKLGEQVKRWWPGAVAVALALAALAAVRLRRRSRLDPA